MIESLSQWGRVAAKMLDSTMPFIIIGVMVSSAIVIFGVLAKKPLTDNYIESESLDLFRCQYKYYYICYYVLLFIPIIVFALVILFRNTLIKLSDWLIHIIVIAPIIVPAIFCIIFFLRAYRAARNQSEYFKIYMNLVRILFDGSLAFLILVIFRFMNAIIKLDQFSSYGQFIEEMRNVYALVASILLLYMSFSPAQIAHKLLSMYADRASAEPNTES